MFLLIYILKKTRTSISPENVFRAKCQNHVIANVTLKTGALLFFNIFMQNCISNGKDTLHGVLRGMLTRL